MYIGLTQSQLVVLCTLFDSVSVGCVKHWFDSVSVGCVVYIGLTQSQLVVLCTLV